MALEVHRAVQTGVDDLADVRHRLAAGGGGGAAPPAVPPLAPPVQEGAMVDVFGNVVPPIALDQVRASWSFHLGWSWCRQGRGAAIPVPCGWQPVVPPIALDQARAGGLHCRLGLFCLLFAK